MIVPIKYTEESTGVNVDMRFDVQVDLPFTHMLEAGSSLPPCGSVRLELLSENTKRPIAVICVIDKSHSMDTANRLTRCIESLGHVIPTEETLAKIVKDSPELGAMYPILSGEDLFGVISFNQAALNTVELREAADASANATDMQRLRAVRPEGSTSILDALKAAVAMASDPRAARHYKHIFFLTDGQDTAIFRSTLNSRGDLTNALVHSAAVRDLHGMERTCLVSCCLGSEADANLMTALTQAAPAGDVIFVDEKKGDIACAGGALAYCAHSSVPHDIRVEVWVEHDAGAYRLTAAAANGISDALTTSAASKRARFNPEPAGAPHMIFRRGVIISRTDPKSIYFPLPELRSTGAPHSPVRLTVKLLVNSLLVHQQDFSLAPPAPFTSISEPCVLPTLQRLSADAQTEVAALAVCNPRAALEVIGSARAAADRLLGVSGLSACCCSLLVAAVDAPKQPLLAEEHDTEEDEDMVIVESPSLLPLPPPQQTADATTKGALFDANILEQLCDVVQALAEDPASAALLANALQARAVAVLAAGSSAPDALLVRCASPVGGAEPGPRLALFRGIRRVLAELQRTSDDLAAAMARGASSDALRVASRNALRNASALHNGGVSLDPSSESASAGTRTCSDSSGRHVSSEIGELRIESAVEPLPSRSGRC